MHKLWPCVDDTADSPLAPGPPLPSTSEGTAWQRAGVRIGRKGPFPSGVSGCVGLQPTAPAGRQGPTFYLGTHATAALRDDGIPFSINTPPFRKFISAFALDPKEAFCFERLP